MLKDETRRLLCSCICYNFTTNIYYKQFVNAALITKFFGPCPSDLRQ